jgi:excinuclease ABC subunit A
MSGGEAQRVKLSRELCKVQTGNTLYVLDEPTTGLHFEDIHRLLQVLQRLVDAGNTVLVIEHNLDVIKCADWVIDLGPEGGHGGGLVIAEGTPEQVARVKRSYTGQFLAPLLTCRGRHVCLDMSRQTCHQRQTARRVRAPFSSAAGPTGSPSRA